jgi:hypothetical protein
MSMKAVRLPDLPRLVGSEVAGDVNPGSGVPSGSCGLYSTSTGPGADVTVPGAGCPLAPPWVMMTSFILTIQVISVTPEKARSDCRPS